MIRVFTACSGYDSQCMALDRIGIDYDLVGWSEIDNFAIMAHDAVYPQYKQRNFGDLMDIDWDVVPDFDLFTYSTPCQDFSQAGKQAGAEKGSGTRSSLLWECERAIAAKKPKYLVFENVAAVASDKFVRLFNKWQLTLEKYGYTNFTQVLNARNHGYPNPIPQNRERLFMVSILDCSNAFYFPDEKPLMDKLVDYLEKDVDDKYYIKEHRLQALMESTQKQKDKGNKYAFSITDVNGVASAITAKSGDRKTDNFIAEPVVLGWTRDASGNIVDRHPVDVANAVTASPRDNTCNYVLEFGNTRLNELIHSQNEKINSGAFLDCYNQKVQYDVAGTIQVGIDFRNLHFITVDDEIYGVRIRKLTQRECFRLMGVTDEDIDKIQGAGISRTQQTHLAGNSICVPCLAAIFYQLFVGNRNKVQQLTIF